MIDKDDTTDAWKCPYCGEERVYIIEDAVLKDDYKEILCGCLACNELFIRQYKFVKIILLNRELKTNSPMKN